jgi:hypothetical protein
VAEDYSQARDLARGAFSASEILGVRIYLGSPVSLDYFDRRPFRFNGKIFAVEVELTQGQGALRVA